MARRDKPKTQEQKAKLADVSPKEAIAELKNDIIEEVRKLSSGKLNSAYGLMELGRELIELEKELVAPKQPEAVLENEF